MAVIEGRCNDRPRAVSILLTRALIGAVSTLAVLLLARPVAADTHTVTNTLDSGPGSLRQAVLDAVPGDVVWFDSTVFSVPLTITLTSGQIEISRSLTIDGAYGGVVTPTISGADTTRIFQVDAGVSVTINHMSLVNGYCGSSDQCHGGAVYNDGALNITGSLLFGNRAAYGGAIFNRGTISITQSSMMSNTALQGSAINNYGTLDVPHSTFFHNGTGSLPGWGGGIMSYGILNIDSTIFTQNSTPNGGGVYVGGGYANISNSSFISNFAVYGGGIRNKYGVVSVINSAFTSNISSLGGGLANYYQTQVINCTFANNFSGSGAIFNETILDVTNSTVVSNTSNPGEGGGISNWALTVLTDTIVANNVRGGDCFTDKAASTIDGGHNLESSNTCGFSATGSITNTNPLLGPLDYYGGPVMTLPLLPGSPAIDAGDAAACPPTDARGGRCRSARTVILAHTRQTGRFITCR